MLLSPPQRPLPQPGAQGRVLAQPEKRGRQGLGIAGRHHQPRLSVAVDPGHAGGKVRADHRPCAQHGLDLHHAEGFLSCDRRENEDVGAPIPFEPLGVADATQEAHTVLHAQIPGQRLQAGPKRAVPHEHERCRHAGQGTQQHVSPGTARACRRTAVGCAEDHRGDRPARAAGVEAVRDHGNLSGADSAGKPRIGGPKR